jgi:hypothetical protein
MKLKPHPQAIGPHSTFRRNPATGVLISHAEWDELGFPVKRTDVIGKSHGGIVTPHTHEYGKPNMNPHTGRMYPGSEVRVRPATISELPA